MAKNILRKDIVDIVNDLSEEYAKQARDAGIETGLDFELMEAYNLIFNDCKGSGIHPTKNSYEMKNGCVFRSGEILGRCAPLINRPGYMKVKNDFVDYEELILKRQERLDWQ